MVEASKNSGVPFDRPWEDVDEYGRTEIIVKRFSLSIDAVKQACRQHFDEQFLRVDLELTKTGKVVQRYVKWMEALKFNLLLTNAYSKRDLQNFKMPLRGLDQWGCRTIVDHLQDMNRSTYSLLENELQNGLVQQVYMPSIIPDIYIMATTYAKDRYTPKYDIVGLNHLPQEIKRQLTPAPLTFVQGLGNVPAYQ